MKYVWIGLTIFAAFGLGKRVIFWAVMSYIFSWAALIAVLLLPANKKRVEERQNKLEEFTKEATEKALVEKEFKNINTVEDLFKQLENK
jgi:molybdopterin-guanine dinucleotide biosynthesis protein A